MLTKKGKISKYAYTRHACNKKF